MKPELARAGARPLRRLAAYFVALLLAGIFCVSQANAQLGMTGVGGGGFGPSGGGSITWTPTFAVANSAGFGSSFNANGLTLGTGDILHRQHQHADKRFPCHWSNVGDRNDCRQRRYDE
jgi:hypothetical protein